MTVDPVGVTMRGDLQLPAVFTVGARIRRVHGGGKLTVDRGALIFDAGRPTRELGGVAEIIHTDDPVVLMTGRLVAPWFNTSVLLHDRGASASVIVPVWVRRRLLSALRLAGFHPKENVTWFRLSDR